MAIEYARTMDVSYEEALRRLDLQSETGEIQQLVAESEPSYFASWLEHEPEFRLVFSFTTPNGDEIIQKYLQDVEWADMVVTQYSEITLEELHSIQRIVSRAARETGVPYESGLNLITGRVTLFTTHVDELRELLETMEHLEQYMDRVEIKHTEDLSVPATLD